MRDGIVEQVGPPLELYDKPANVFVASFIGSPSMNFIAGRLGEDLMSVSTSGGVRLPLHQVMAAKPGAEVTYGIRPEHLALAEGGQGFPMVVTNVEPTGSETFVQGTVDGQVISALLRQRHAIRPGEVLNLAFQSTNGHLFDTASGMRLNRDTSL